MTEDLQVTLIQSEQIWENKTANLANYEQLLSAQLKTDLIVLPEMFNTGFSMNAAFLAEQMDDSPSIKWLIHMAKKKHAAIYTSLIIKEDEKYYNRGIFVSPDGDFRYYDKRKTFGLAGEDKIYASGKQNVCVSYKNWAIQLQICYDLRFPEISLNYLQGDSAQYDLVLYVANWPSSRKQAWCSLLPARAIENQTYVVGVNRVGTDNTNRLYFGDSSVFDLLGSPLLSMGNKQAVASVCLSYEKLVSWRKKYPFLKDRNIK